jgi:hypothetical protein
LVGGLIISWTWLSSGRDEPTPQDLQQTLAKLEANLSVRSTEVAFDRSAGRWLLQEGFHHPDRDGAWTSQSTATIRFTSEEFDDLRAVKVSMVPLLSTDRRFVAVTLKSSVDQVMTLLNSEETILIALDGSASQVIQVLCDDPITPYELGLGLDLRRQCVKIRSLELVGE